MKQRVQVNADAGSEPVNSATPANVQTRVAPIQTGLMLTHQAGELRDRTREVAKQVDAVNGVALRALVNEQIESHLKLSLTQLLDLLGNEWGVAWSDVAGCVGVSVQALRKWRQGQPAIAEHRMALATLAATLNVLSSFQVQEPVSWLELPILEGYRPRRKDLLTERREVLLDLARGQLRPEQAMEELSPDWRDSLRSHYEVFEAADGALSTRKRQ
jgi:hypothetical protein